MPISGPTIGATSTLAVEENVKGLRRLLVLCNNSDEDMYACPGPVAIATRGIPLVAAGGSWTDKPDLQGWMYQGQYKAICASGGKILSVTELNRGPQ
ncbi:hypothetical protein ES705_36270 [subsurface metagenome]